MSKVTLEKGLEIVRFLETQLTPKHAHCALAGSVLHKGESEKDLDIIIYPHNEKNSLTVEALEAVVVSLFPDAHLVTDTSYPHDRLLYRVRFGEVLLELFIFTERNL